MKISYGGQQLKEMSSMKISYDGQHIILTLPSPLSSARAHVLRIPIEKCGICKSNSGNPLPSQVGWNHLLSILKAQHAARTAAERCIGTRAAPVQYDLEQIKRVLSKRKARPEMTLEDLGL